MPVSSTTRDSVTIVAPTGVIDTRTAQAFEAEFVRAFNEGTRAFAVDFGRVDLITSAGIRVLVMMAHRLQRGSGGLVLFALGPRVRTVFEIGGLLGQFQFTDTEADAIGRLAAPKPAAAAAASAPRPSRLSETVVDALGGDPLRRERGRAAGTASTMTPLTAAVVDALGAGEPAGAEAPDPKAD
jgi:stage II sporulation protein AA (anti-sigma F factor antagonist)